MAPHGHSLNPALSVTIQNLHRQNALWWDFWLPQHASPLATSACQWTLHKVHYSLTVSMDTNWQALLIKHQATKATFYLIKHFVSFSRLEKDTRFSYFWTRYCKLICVSIRFKLLLPSFFLYYAYFTGRENLLILTLH